MSKVEQGPPSSIEKPPTEEQEQLPRKKRAKIMSACSECRRKKTKCNGEQPCRNCQKSYTTASNCVYAATTSHTSSATAGRSMLEKENQKLSMALEEIEVRLKSIEEMLRLFAVAHQQQHGGSSASIIEFGGGLGGHHRLPSIHNLSAPPPAVFQSHEQQAANSTINIPPPHAALQPRLIQPHIDETSELYNKRKR